MQQISNGKYLGKNTFEYRFGGLIVTQNHYDEASFSDWHYHENSFFAFILKGGSIEIRKKEKIECVPGMLLFYDIKERHKNERYKSGSRNFSVEFEENWLKQMDINRNGFEGNFIVENLEIKSLLLKLMLEVKFQYTETQLAVEMLAAKMLGHFSNAKTEFSNAPDWLQRIKGLLHDSPGKPFSLSELATFSGVHPVTISKLFPRFFGVGVGDYIRKLRIENSFQLLSKRHTPLETIAKECGFADHAHFSRTFKKHKGITPSRYRELIFG